MRGRTFPGLTALLALIALVSLLTAASAGAVVSNTPLSSPWVTNGNVNALAQMGSRLYIGGAFSFIGPETGPGALFDETKAGYAGGAVSLKPGFPDADGAIDAVISDGSGGFYVGGSFASIGGVAQGKLAHVTATNHVDSAFRPAIHGTVDALAQSSGQLFAGGSFDTVDGHDESNVTSLDPATGGVTAAWIHPDVRGVDGAVAALAVSGSTLYVGGAFSSVLIGGGSASGATDLIGLKTADGTPATPTFKPSLDTSGAGVLALQVGIISGLPALLVGGDFQTPHTNLAVFNRSDGSDIPLSGYPDGPVQAMAYDDASHQSWIGGSFSNVGVSHRGGLARYNGPTLDPTWNPDVIGGSVRALELNGPSSDSSSKLIVGGDFRSAVAGGNETLRPVLSRPGLAAIAPSSQTASPFDAPLGAWNPGAGGPVSALGLQGSLVFAGGSFASADGLPRTDLAALDLPGGTGDTGFTADTDDQVWTLATSASRLYAGGNFSHVDGASAPSLAQLNPTSGELAAGFTPPLSSGLVEALTFSADGMRLYAGGQSLGTVAGSVNLGGFDAATGAFELGKAPDTDAGGAVVRLLTGGSTIYAGGHFTQFGGVARSYVAAFSSATGAVSPSFVPTISPSGGSPPGVTALALTSSHLYIGGQFLTVGGASHVEIAALNPTSAKVDNAWDANLDGGVTGLAVLQHHVYAAGGFQNAGPTMPRFGLAAFTLDDGALNGEWHPSLTGAPGLLSDAFAGRGHALLPVGNTLWMGDAAEMVNGATRPGLAEFTFTALHATTPGPPIHGSPWPEQRLACAVGGFIGGPEAYAFAWLRDGTAIPGATAQTFTLRSADLGHGISCRVTATNPAGRASSTSPATRVSHRPGGPRMKLASGARASIQGVVGVKVGCPRGFTLCAGKLSVKTRGSHATSLGGGAFSLHGARSVNVRIKLSKSTFKRLKRQHSLSATASATAHDASARYATVTTKLTLLAPKRSPQR